MRGDTTKEKVPVEGVTGITEIISMTVVIEIILTAKIIRTVLRTEVPIAYMRDMELLGVVRLLTLR